MDGIWPFFLLAIGFVFLIKGADFFVDGASGIAKLLKIPSVVIGLTIVAFGTSAPELAVSVTSAIKGQNGIAIGNVIGSNIFNLLMVVGVAALIRPLTVEKNLVRRDFPFSILCTLVVLFMSVDFFLGDGEGNVLSRGEGLVLLCFFAVFMYSLVVQTKNSKVVQPESVVEEIKSIPWWKAGVLSVIGILGIVFGGEMVVRGASTIALSLGMSEMLIGVTIIAIGTSLPELVTSIVAARKGECDIAVGNVIGSNIFNLLLILGVSAVINPIVLPSHVFIDMLILLGMSIISFLFALNRKISRVEGGIFIVAYFGYLAYSILFQYL